MQKLEKTLRFPDTGFVINSFKRELFKKTSFISNKKTAFFNILLFLSALPFLLFLFLPVIAIILRVSPISFFHYLVKPEIIHTILLSFFTSTGTIMIILILGTPLAYFLSGNNFPGKKVIETFIDLPTVLPPAVAGLGLLMAFGRRGLLGETFEMFGFEVAFTPLAVILAQTFVASPYYIKSAAAGFLSVNKELEHAAAVDGANPWQIFYYITLPLTGHFIINGLILSWARSLGEFGATIIFAGNFAGKTQTMPLAVYLGFQTDLDQALTLAVILLFISFAILFLFKSVCGFRRFSWPSAGQKSSSSF